MDNPKVIVGKDKLGQCLVAGEDIIAGELIAEFDGEIYGAENVPDLPKGRR